MKSGEKHLCAGVTDIDGKTVKASCATTEIDINFATEQKAEKFAAEWGGFSEVRLARFARWEEIFRSC